MKKIIRFSAFVFLILFSLHCGGGGGGGGSDGGTTGGTTGGVTGGDGQNTVNLKKLEGTPFANQTIGDSIDPKTFYCGQYRTDTITGFPIKIFAAYFTASEEEIIKEGIKIANDAMQADYPENIPSEDLPAYEWTDTWSADGADRVIYKVSSLDSYGNATSAVTLGVDYDYDGKENSQKISTDWVILIQNPVAILNKFLPAHEIAHGTGIPYHRFINYASDGLEDLEDHSLMLPNGAAFNPPAMNDYNVMMGAQGAIMKKHLNDPSGQLSATTNATCD